MIFPFLPLNLDSMPFFLHPDGPATSDSSCRIVVLLFLLFSLGSFPFFLFMWGGYSYAHLLSNERPPFVRLPVQACLFFSKPIGQKAKFDLSLFQSDFLIKLPFSRTSAFSLDPDQVFSPSRSVGRRVLSFLEGLTRPKEGIFLTASFGQLSIPRIFPPFPLKESRVPPPSRFRSRLGGILFTTHVSLPFDVFSCLLQTDLFIVRGLFW